MLLHSPADAAGVKPDALTAVCRFSAADALQRGLSLVQSLELPEAVADGDALRAAGFWQLADLLYMRVATDKVADTARDDLTWRRHGTFDEQELARVIAATYEGSLDCPGLAGLRDVRDVIEGHRGGGVFTPDTWWIADRDGDPAGCVLVNDSSSASSSEVVYLGVTPAHRGAGVGEALVRRAAAGARARQRATLTLAVDAANVHARRVYERLGFRLTERRISYVVTSRDPLADLRR
jgi:ribosomal protein S18 acetylase RimI-like enzyme